MQGESNSLWKTLFDKAVDAILITRGSELIVEACNEEACRMTGYPQDQLTGMKAEDLFSAQSIAKEPFQKGLLEEGQSVYRERILIRADGTEIPVEMHSKRMPDGSYQTFLRDITQARKVLEELTLSEEKFAKAFKTSPDAVNLTRLRDGLYLEINEGFTAMSGYTSEDVVGRSSLPGDLGIWVHAEDRQRAIAELKANGMVKNYEAAFRRKDGTQFFGNFSARKLVFGGEECLLSITRDITEKKRTEEALRSAQKLEALGVLAGGIAHDFNNLLTGVFGFIALAKTNLPDESPAQRDLDRALAVFDRAKALSYQLLTFAKGGAPAKQPVVLTRLLQESVRFALSGSSVDAEVKAPDDLAPCLADVHQIGQVLDNLLINARDAMAGRGRVLVEACNVSADDPVPTPLEPGSWVKVSVSDEGTGIAPEVLPRIFDPFFTTKASGHGLGLATAFSILKRHGGTLVAESGGHGSRFSFWLPSAEVPCPKSETEGRGTHRSCRLLLLDDEEFIRSLAAQLFPAWGHQVTTAASAQETVDLYEQARRRGEPFDLVLLDLTIRGGEGGRETLDRLKKLDPHVRAAASSGYSDDPVMADPVRFGFLGRLAKPYRQDDFEALLASLPRRLSEPAEQ
jgi:PAS domain S-box-containing protein